METTDKIEEVGYGGGAGTGRGGAGRGEEEVVGGGGCKQESGVGARRASPSVHFISRVLH